MRIGVDATVLTRPHTTGVERYTRSLLDAVIPAMGQDEFVLCVLGSRGATGIQHPNAVERPVPWVPPRAYKAVVTYLGPVRLDALARIRADVFVFPDFVRFPVDRSARSVVVVYDLGFLVTPDHVTPRNRRYLRRMVPRSIAAADAVVAISEHGKREIVEHYRVDPDKITVVHPAAGDEFFLDRQPRDSDLRRYGVDRPYILYAGTLEPRKNIAGLIAAYERLPASLRDGYSLVLAGRPGWLSGGIDAAIADARRRGRDVRVTGYVAAADLPALYANAVLFVYPSFYEGFGMPPLEAMAAGVPVVSSDVPSLRESVGDAALVCAPTDPSALAAGIATVLTDATRRQAMVRAGRRQAERFSWESSARTFADLLRRLAGRP